MVEDKTAFLESISKQFDKLDSSHKTRERLGIPKRYLDSRLDNFVGNVSDDVVKWTQRASENLLIHSPKAGNGKTHLAISCMVEMVKSLKDGCIDANADRYDKYCSATSAVMPKANFVNFADLMLEIKASFDSQHTTEGDVIKKYCALDVLVVDDLGAEKTSEYAHAVIYSILNNRYEDMKPTIITTNLSSKDITGSYGGRILSRIASGSVITLDGNDRRLNQ